MAGRLLVGCFLSAALAFLLLLSSGSKVEATTFKVNYSGSLSCAGLDGIVGNADDSCTAGTQNNPGATADLKTIFEIPTANPRHANFTSIDTFGVPVSWWLALDSNIDNGAYVGTLYARSTLSILNGTCTTPYNVNVTIPLYDCSTDITDTITWDVPSGGINLTADVAPANGLPDGCDHFPTHALLDPDGPFVDANHNGICDAGDTGCKPPLQPRARAYGYTNVIADAPPTQINFVFYDPGQLSLMTAPESYMGDSLGYANFVIMDNPSAPVTPSAISEFCTPLDTTTTMLGLTAGKGVAIAQVGAHPEYTAMCTGAQIGVDDDGDGTADDGCFVVTDKCYDGSGSDPMCGEVRSINPTVPGIYNTGSHLADAYAESQRDQDGDGFSNNMDSCPYASNPAPGGTDNTYGCDGCAAGTCTKGDQDSDGFMNRQDLCPFVADDQTDNDKDGIGKACDTDNGTKVPPNGDLVPDGPFVNDFPIASVCIGEADTDGDGWCDSTETLLGSATNNAASTPEFKGIDYKVVAAQTPPGQAAQSCTNLSYYGTVASGVAVDDDGDTLANAADPACSTAIKCYDKTLSEDGAGVNTCGDLIDNGADTVADAADPDCWVTVDGAHPDADADGICNNSDNCPGTAPGKDANPAQLNTDANGTWAGDGDTTGDACDGDDDNDGASDLAEWGHGTDPKSNGRSPFDLQTVPDQKVSILDVLLYKPKLEPNPYDYKFDMNLDGKVSILDVLLFKPVLNLEAVDKYDVGVFLSGPGVIQNRAPTQTRSGDYSVTMTVASDVVFTAISRENNRGPDTVPAGMAVIHFYCDAQAVAPATNHNQILCGFVAGGADIQTTNDRFVPCVEFGTVTRCFSAVAQQVWGTASSVKEPGDGLNWISESGLHFVSTVSEPKNTNVDFTRTFGLRCNQAGSYDVRIYNKTLPRVKLLWAEWNLSDNESMSYLHVTCVP
jgi:hypothetical protein